MNSYESFGILFAQLNSESTPLLLRESGHGIPAGPILLGAGSNGVRHLLVPLETDFAVTESHGHSLSLTERVVDRGGVRTRCLDLACFDNSLGRVFAALVDSLIERIDSSPETAPLAVEKALEEWRDLFASAHYLSEEAARGLFGELTVLSWLAEVNPVAAVAVWSGPDKALHDFMTNKGHVEVKSSGKANLEIMVSDLVQLDPTDSPGLTLIRVQIETAPDGVSVGELLDQLYQAGCPGDLVSKACKVGYVQGITQDSFRFRLVEDGHRMWEIGPDFPSLRRTDVPDRMKGAVTKLRYTVSLQNAPGELSFSDARGRLQELIKP